MAVTFMSRDICNHVLLRVHHLANRLVVLLESRVFSSLAKLLHLATRIKVDHKTNFSSDSAMVAPSMDMESERDKAPADLHRNPWRWGGNMGKHQE